MYKLLIDSPSGKQIIESVGVGGGYFDMSLVIWDERIDGALADITPGGYIKENGLLVFNQARQDTHDAAIAAELIPEVVTMRQAELALKDAGYFGAVQTWVSGLDGELESYWQRSLDVKRSHDFVEAARVELGITDAQMDALFVLAASKEE